MRITLSKFEQAILFQQNPTTERKGGFQGLLVKLQRKLDSQTGIIDLTERDLERIRRYAFDYGNGGWEGRLKSIFERSLGPNLDLN
jgi:hypothetical protein